MALKYSKCLNKYKIIRVFCSMKEHVWQVIEGDPGKSSNSLRASEDKMKKVNVDTILADKSSFLQDESVVRKRG